MSDSEEEEAGKPRLSWKDKGKAKVRPVPELPEEVWKRIFELYYDQCADDWSTSGQVKDGLLPLLISSTHARVATPVLYSHPHISSHSISHFIRCVRYPTRYTDALTKIPLVRHLTVRPTPIMPAYEQIIVERDRPEIVNPLFPTLTAMFPNVHSFTLKDTLVVCSEDAKCVFAGLANMAPKKARMELRMWDLYDSTIGPDLIAATRPNVYALPQSTKQGSGEGTGAAEFVPFLSASGAQMAWRDAIIGGLDLHLPTVWLDPPQPTPGGNNHANQMLPTLGPPTLAPGINRGLRPIPQQAPTTGSSVRGSQAAVGGASTQQSSYAAVSSGLMSVPPASSYGQNTITQAANHIVNLTGSDDVEVNDDNADDDDDGESQSSEDLARALMEEDRRALANSNTATVTDNTTARPQSAQHRAEIARLRADLARQRAEEIRYQILLARSSAGGGNNDYGDNDAEIDDPAYIRFRDAWRAAESEARAAEQDMLAQRQGLGSLPSRAISGSLSAALLGQGFDAQTEITNHESTTDDKATPSDAPTDAVQPSTRATSSLLHGNVSATSPIPCAASQTVSQAVLDADPVPSAAVDTAPSARVASTSGMNSGAPSSTPLTTPIAPAAAPNEPALDPSTATPIDVATVPSSITEPSITNQLAATPAAATGATSVAATHNTDGAGGANATLGAQQAQPRQSNTSATSSSAKPRISMHGLTYAQSRKIDHIYYPPAEEADPPVAGPSGSNSIKGDNHDIPNADTDTLVTGAVRKGYRPDSSLEAAPYRLTASVRQSRGIGTAQAHEMRGMLLDLIQNQWNDTLQAFSFVAFDPIASLVVRAPHLDFWVNVPIEHVRVHLPRGVNPLAIFKTAKQNERDRIRSRREAQAQAQDGETDETLASLTALAEGIMPDDDDRVVGTDEMGGGLVHPLNKLFEIEVNTVKDMMDDMWNQAGSQLPPQVCRILLGEQEWSDVMPGKKRYPTSEMNEPDDFPSPQTADYASPTYSISSIGSSDDVGDSDADVDGYDLDEDTEGGGGCYDAEAAKRQAERLADRAKTKRDE